MMPSNELKIGPYYCGRDYRPLVVAELSANHGSSEKQVVDSIEAAQLAGVDFFKVQIFKADEMARVGARVSMESPKWAGELYSDLYRKTEMPDHLVELAFSECKRRDLPIFASAFSPEDVVRAAQLGSCAIKIASPEVGYLKLLAAAGHSQLPVIVSTGAATRQDLVRAADILLSYSSPFMFLHCVSEYPCPASLANLTTIPVLEQFFGVPVGYSDHTLGTWAAVSAVTLGASMIEKHFTLNSGFYSEDVDFSANPEQMARLVNDVVRTRSALGSPRIPTILNEPVSVHKRNPFDWKRPYLDDSPSIKQ